MKLPALYRKRRGAGGAYYGSYLAKVAGVEVSLNTKNATIAYERLGEAMRGKRDWPSDAELAARALEGGPAAAAAAGPPVPDAGGPGDIPAPAAAAATAPPVVPDHIEPPRLLPPIQDDAQAEAEATNAAAAETAGAGGADPPVPPPPEVSNQQLALLGVELQLWVAQQYARNKVWKGYTAPQLPAEAKAPLAEQWEKIIAYSNLGAVLPPWVTGLVIPGVTIVVATATLGQVFAEQAAQQKRAAGVQDERPAADPPAAQAAA